MAFSFFISRCFQVDWTIRLAFVHQGAELLSGRVSVADTTLKESSLEEHPPALVDGDFTKIGDQGADGFIIAEFLLDLDCFNEEVLVKAGELEALDQNFS